MGISGSRTWLSRQKYQVFTAFGRIEMAFLASWLQATLKQWSAVTLEDPMDISHFAWCSHHCQFTILIFLPSKHFFRGTEHAFSTSLPGELVDGSFSAAWSVRNTITNRLLYITYCNYCIPLGWSPVCFKTPDPSTASFSSLSLFSSQADIEWNLRLSNRKSTGNSHWAA